jgi:predicted phage terminase large subunit-like protein
MWGRREPGAKLWFIMSRWHEDDPIGRLRKGAFHFGLWTFLKITALAESEDILGREVGEALWPQRWSRAYLEAEQKANPRNFNARYQANPTSVEGDFFQPDNIGWCSRNDISPSWTTVQAFDLGYSKSGDPTAWCQMWRSPDGRFWLDVDQIQEELDERNKWINRKARQSGAKCLVPQDGGSGKDVVKQLIRLLAGIQVIGHTVTKKDGDKANRASGFAAQVNGGSVMMVDSPVARGFIEQMRVFPHGAHDDIIDASSDAFNDLVAAYDGDAWFDL